MKILLFICSGLTCILLAGGTSSQLSYKETASSDHNPDGKTPSVATTANDLIVDRGYVLLRSDGRSPVRITDVSPLPAKSDFRKGVMVEVLNTSDKTVAFVDLAVSVPPTCLSFYLSGDILVDESRSDRAQIAPNTTKHLSVPSKTAQMYLPPAKYTKHCAPDERKPVIYVWAVEFSDGSRWLRNPE